MKSAPGKNRAGAERLGAVLIMAAVSAAAFGSLHRAGERPAPVQNFSCRGALVMEAEGAEDWQSCPCAVRFLLGRRMNLNEAESPDLAMLEGIGPATAEKILAARSENGGFLSPADWESIPGLSQPALASLDRWGDVD